MADTLETRTMTAPSKLDEARLRELIGDAVLSACGEYSDVKAARIKDLPFHTRCIVTNATDAIWDALSAERERGDRAVASAATAFQALNGIPPHRIIDGLTVEWCVSDDVPEDIYTAKSHLQVVLATQKAEGAE